MDQPPPSLTDLQRQLSETRSQLSRTAAGLGAAMDVPARVRRTVSAHPVKWALLALAGGVLVARALPLVAGLVRSTGSRRLLGTLVTTLGPVALQAGLRALAAHRPDLAEKWTGDSGLSAEAPTGAGAGRGEGEVE